MQFSPVLRRLKLDKSLHDKLETIENSLPEIEKQLSAIDISRDQKGYAEMAKKHSDVSTIVDLFNQWKNIVQEIKDAEELMEVETDEDMKQDFEDIILLNKPQLDPLIQKIKISLLPKDPLDEKDVLVEIRPGAGGEEAAIWVGDLYKMYTRFAERNAWNVEPIELTASDQGGYNKIIFSIKSKGVYSKLKFEAGAHRVQRIPKTESQGRVHTSISTVAVLPEAEEVDLSIAPNDLKIDVSIIITGSFSSSQPSPKPVDSEAGFVPGSTARADAPALPRCSWLLSNAVSSNSDGVLKLQACRRASLIRRLCGEAACLTRLATGRACCSIHA